MNLNAAFILKFFLIKCESDDAICRYIYYSLNTYIISAQCLIPFLVFVSFVFVQTSWVSISFIGFHSAINSSRHYKLCFSTSSVFTFYLPSVYLLIVSPVLLHSAETHDRRLLQWIDVTHTARLQLEGTQNAAYTWDKRVLFSTLLST